MGTLRQASKGLSYNEVLQASEVKAEAVGSMITTPNVVLALHTYQRPYLPSCFDCQNLADKVLLPDGF